MDPAAFTSEKDLQQTVQDLIEDSAAKYGFTPTTQGHKNPHLVRYYYMKGEETDENLAVTKNTWQASASVDANDLGKLVDGYNNPDADVGAKQQTWNTLFAGLNSTKTKLKNLADELDEQQAKLAGSAKQPEAAEVFDKVTALRQFLNTTLRVKLSQWEKAEATVVEEKLDELTKLSEDATTHQAAVLAYLKALKSKHNL